jgi:hypothetical protein
MYSTCLHCQRPLGANESIEHFPVARRIAFDAAKGRLWAVCAHCQRWNLAPFETRWEALEECERAFRDTRVRVSTDHIGLARLPDRTELVRIGAPQRPEFAAWRYGDQFGRRRKQAILYGAGIVGGIGLGAAGIASLGMGAAAIMPIFHVLNIANVALSGALTRRPLPHPDGGYFMGYRPPVLEQRDDRPEGWGIAIGYTALMDRPVTLRTPLREVLRTSKNIPLGTLRFGGREATAILQRSFTGINKAGARASDVADGVRLIEEVGDPARFGEWAAGQRRAWSAQQLWGDNGDLTQIPRAARLAFEMALNEDAERRALEGELALLEAAWRDAEEVAHIADNLLIPSAVDDQLSTLKQRTDRDAS